MDTTLPLSWSNRNLVLSLLTTSSLNHMQVKSCSATCPRPAIAMALSISWPRSAVSGRECDLTSNSSTYMYSKYISSLMNCSTVHCCSTTNTCSTQNWFHDQSGDLLVRCLWRTLSCTSYCMVFSLCFLFFFHLLFHLCFVFFFFFTFIVYFSLLSTLTYAHTVLFIIYTLTLFI